MKTDVRSSGPLETGRTSGEAPANAPQGHTPGPWWFNGTHVRKTFQPPTNGQSSYRLATIESDVVTYVPESMANGRLMAAAPELLSALQWVLSATGEELHSAFDAAQAAIAKATRGSA